MWKFDVEVSEIKAADYYVMMFSSLVDSCIACEKYFVCQNIPCQLLQRQHRVVCIQFEYLIIYNPELTSRKCRLFLQPNTCSP